MGLLSDLHVDVHPPPDPKPFIKLASVRYCVKHITTLFSFQLHNQASK